MPRAYRDWTARDDILLTKLWEDRATLTIETMAAALDCNHKAIERRVNHLGLTPKTQRANDIWTIEKVQLLKDMWPSHSSREIATVLGTTRNAILGKKHRLDLDAKGNQLQRTPEYIEKLNAMRRQTERNNKAALRERTKVFNRTIKGTGKPQSLPLLPPDAPPPAGAPEGMPVRLVNLTPMTCRAIVGRSDIDKLATFCPGHRVAKNMPYCSYHHELYYNIQPHRRAHVRRG